MDEVNEIPFTTVMTYLQCLVPVLPAEFYTQNLPTCSIYIQTWPFFLPHHVSGICLCAVQCSLPSLPHALRHLISFRSYCLCVCFTIQINHTNTTNTYQTFSTHSPLNSHPIPSRCLPTVYNNRYRSPVPHLLTISSTMSQPHRNASNTTTLFPLLADSNNAPPYWFFFGVGSAVLTALVFIALECFRERKQRAAAALFTRPYPSFSSLWPNYNQVMVHGSPPRRM